ncbi:MAG: CDP-glycerol glycerophosphotransferase family protein, partial [Thermodesulfovibrionales bacterium]
VYHGTSDKMFTMPDKRLNLDWFDYYFLSGNKDLYKLKQFSHNSERLDNRVVKIGMFRSDKIFKGDYNREKILKKYKIKPDGKKIILYAPTWEWGGGTLGTCFDKFASEITKKYILIIRPHANDRKNIKYISKRLKKNRNENLYFFPKQSQDVMDFIYISDLMIGDHSAVNYDFVLTLKSMVFVKSDTEDVFIPPDEYNVKLCGPMYDPENDDILKKIEEAFSNPLYLKRMKHLVQNSFYYNDGHAVDRACSFIVNKLSEMGMIDRDAAFRKLKKRFTYMDNYK